MLKTTLKYEDVFTLCNFIRVYYDYKGYSTIINQENHNTSGLFLVLERLPEDFLAEEPKFEEFENLKDELLKRLYEDKAIILDLRNNQISNNITLKPRYSLVHDLFPSFQSIKELAKAYFGEKTGTKRETALSIHLLTSIPIIVMSQTSINTTGTGPIYFLIKPGLYVKSYLKHISTLPYSYYINPEESLTLILETHIFKNNQQKIIHKEIVNWKDYAPEFLKFF